MSDRQPRKRRTPRPATPERLRKAALAHIDRYATSAANLHAVLMRRVERSARLHGTERDEGREWADAIVADFVSKGLLDDTAFAETKAHSLHRSGASRRKIAGMLDAKGVGEGDIAAALDAVADEWADAELAAACRHARRRRLGPWRNPEDRAARRERDLASMGRAGFGYGLACRVIDAEDVEALEEEARFGPG